MRFYWRAKAVQRKPTIYGHFTTNLVKMCADNWVTVKEAHQISSDETHTFAFFLAVTATLHRYKWKKSYENKKFV